MVQIQIRVFWKDNELTTVSEILRNYESSAEELAVANAIEKLHLMGMEAIGKDSGMRVSIVERNEAQSTNSPAPKQ